MNSKKSILSILVLATIGGLIFSQTTLFSSAIAFVIGVFASAFIIHFSSHHSDADAEQKPSPKTLYVGNLPYKANESLVHDLFSEYGKVFSVRLMKDKRTGKRRGFGFVVMASSDADGAVAALNEKDYMQRTLKVRIANDPKHPETNIDEQE